MPNKVKYFYELTVSSSPHVHGPNRTGRLMLDVILALLPALVGSVVYFGPRVLLVCGLSVAGCVFFEWGYRKVMKLDNTVGDLSAVVTGLLLALCVPPKHPLLDHPHRGFLRHCRGQAALWGHWQKLYESRPGRPGISLLLAGHYDHLGAAGQWPSLFGSNVDAVTAATPLANLHQNLLPTESLTTLFLGKTGGLFGGDLRPAAVAGRPVLSAPARHSSADSPVLPEHGGPPYPAVPPGQ